MQVNKIVKLMSSSNQLCDMTNLGKRFLGFHLLLSLLTPTCCTAGFALIVFLRPSTHFVELKSVGQSRIVKVVALKNVRGLECSS